MTTATRHATRPASPTAPDWSQAVCARTDTALFFPEGRGRAAADALKEAKKVCAGCPVQAACLEWAIETGQSSGVWGGFDETERRIAMRQRAAQRQTSYARCIDEQEYIEERVAEGASHRQIAGELGVCHTSVGRAWRYFQTEQQAVTA